MNARRSGENRGIRCDGGLLLNGYRATDRVSFWLLLGHVPLIVALAFLRSTWSEAVFWGGGAVAAGMFRQSVTFASAR